MKQNLSVLNYQSTNTPHFTESNNKKYIEMGADNHYPHYLESLFASSSINGAVVKGCAEMIYGDGLDSVDKDSQIEQWLKVKQIFGSGDCLRRATFDLKLYGQCYLNIIWSQDRSTISEVHHIPASTIRCGVPDDEDNFPLYYHSVDWYSNKEPQPIPAFNVADRTAASQLLHIKLYSPLSYAYGLPDYLSSTPYIQVDCDLAAYHQSNITNGLFPSCMINFADGVPTEQERAELERLIYNKFGGATNAGKILMTFSDSKENAPTIEPLNLSEAHKTYDFLSREVQTKILSGHRVTTPLLFGIRTEGGGFGSNADEMKDGYDLFFRTVIKPMQELFLDGLRPILAASSITIPLHFKKLVPADFLEESAEKEEVRPMMFSEDTKKISLEDSEAWLMHLSDKATTMKEGWQLWRTEVAEDTEQDKWFHSFKKMHRAFAYDNVDKYADYDMDSDYDVISPKGYLFAVRYSYIENAKTPPENPNYKSRDFCEAMMDLSNGGAMYRYEDIEDMSEDGVNGQFAPAGESEYSILKYKGGCFCRHAFQRNIYIYAPDGDIAEFSEEQNVEIQGDFDAVMNRVGDNPYVVNEGYETIAPIDMPNRGSLKYPNPVN